MRKQDLNDNIEDIYTYTVASNAEEMVGRGVTTRKNLRLTGKKVRVKAEAQRQSVGKSAWVGVYLYKNKI